MCNAKSYLKPELLVPAGDREALEAAVLYGADAVYLGAENYGMRAASKNFSLEDLYSAVIYAHAKGVKVYLTCNIIPNNEEAKNFSEFIKKAQNTGIDAVIVTDIGIFEAVKTHAPELEIHISTQMGIMNFMAAETLYKYGAKRVILARETSLAEIRTIRENVSPELTIEAFVHGAMCMSFSGRCLLSMYMTGRDANRGKCAQSCRWNYHLAEETRPGEFFNIYEEDNSSYILNSKDLCMLEHLEKLADAGVTSFKIEGRAKSAYYVASITNAYRLAIDYMYRSEPLPDWVIKETEAVSHRKYCTGFYFGHPNDCQYYKNSGYERKYNFIGKVNGYKDGLLHITQRNYFTAHDEIEVLIPGEKSLKLYFSGILNREGEKIEIANKATEQLSIITEQNIPSGVYLRTPYKE